VETFRRTEAPLPGGQLETQKKKGGLRGRIGGARPKGWWVTEKKLPSSRIMRGSDWKTGKGGQRNGIVSRGNDMQKNFSATPRNHCGGSHTNKGKKN